MVFLMSEGDVHSAAPLILYLNFIRTSYKFHMNPESKLGPD